MCVRLRMEGNGVGYITATVATPGEPNFTAHVRTFFAIAASGFRRYATYRQATVASVATNSMFGFLRTYVLLSVAGTTGLAVGYGADQLATYAWVGQGLIGVVMFWGWSDLSDRVRSGDVITDLLRPIHPVINYLATDLGRAAYGLLSRFLPPVLIGAIFFDLFVPARLVTYPVFVLSTLLATMASFGCRFLVNAVSYWLLDIRGVLMVWVLASGLLSGLYFPLRFLPQWLATTLWAATPFPSILQTPLDVIVERDGVPVQLAYVGLQAAWVVVLLLSCREVQRRAERRLVIQGG